MNNKYDIIPYIFFHNLGYGKFSVALPIQKEPCI